MKRQLKILLTGLLVVVPFGVTCWAIWTVGLWLDKLGVSALKPIWNTFDLESRWDWDLNDVHGFGAILLILIIYSIGLLMHFWLFRRLVWVVERLFERVPGVKTIYESVRDLMKLFGPDSATKMGKVVEYRPPGTQVGVLGILTNEQPSGASEPDAAAVYFPLSYMIGGPVLFVPKENLRDVDMPVERALRLCTTAQVSTDQAGQTHSGGKSGLKTAKTD